MSDSTIAAVLLIGVVAGYMLVSWLFDLVSAQRTPPAPSGRDQAESEAPRPRRTASPARWFEVLQVAPSASDEEIKQAYRHLIQQYHPDKVASLGVELRALAEVKSREITAAYQEGLAVRASGSSR